MNNTLLDKFVESFYENEIKKKCKEIPNSIGGFVPIAVSLAYEDTKRVCKGIGEYVQKKSNALNEIMGMINSFICEPILYVGGFCSLHGDLCQIWVDAFPGDTSLGTYGKAQKVVNMTFKYLHAYSYINKKHILDKFEECHFTLDSYTLEWLYECKKSDGKEGKLTKEEKEKLRKLKSDATWSSLSPSDYEAIQNYACRCVKNRCENWTPLQAEYVVWENVKLWNMLKSASSIMDSYPDSSLMSRCGNTISDPGCLLGFIKKATE